jgi:hypothetical protein
MLAFDRVTGEEYLSNQAAEAQQAPSRSDEVWRSEQRSDPGHKSGHVQAGYILRQSHQAGGRARLGAYCHIQVAPAKVKGREADSKARGLVEPAGWRGGIHCDDGRGEGLKAGGAIPTFPPMPTTSFDHGFSRQAHLTAESLNSNLF